MNRAPAIEFQAVDKRFGAQRVLEAVSLEVRDGECFALLGDNGAGKTTCIKCLLDFQHIDGGTIGIFGIDHRRSESRRRLAFLPEGFVPPQHMSGLEFLRYSESLRGARTADGTLSRRASAMELSHGALSRPVHTYSKGMAQKLGLLACLDSDQDLLVLDEPMSGLDPRSRIAVRDRLRELANQGRTVLFTTHSLHDVELICDRFAILHGARIAFLGTPAACCSRFRRESLEEAYLDCTSKVEEVDT